jgi:hypothetical protein
MVMAMRAGWRSGWRDLTWPGSEIGPIGHDGFETSVPGAPRLGVLEHAIHVPRQEMQFEAMYCTDAWRI